MLDQYIPGRKVCKEFELLPKQLGQACHDGELQAYTKDSRTIIDASKLERIPKYAPEGVDPYKHRQRALIPKWDWRDDLCECPNKGAACKGCNSLYAEGHLIEKKVSSNAIFDHIRSGNFYYRDLRRMVSFMQTEYSLITEGIAAPFALVNCLRIEDYIKIAQNRNQRAKYEDMFSEYEKLIDKLFFKRVEVEKWASNYLHTVDMPTQQVSIPTEIVKKYNQFLEGKSRKTTIRAYLLAAQGGTNEQVAEQTGYAISSITHDIKEGHYAALKNKLPSLVAFANSSRKPSWEKW